MIYLPFDTRKYGQGSLVDLGSHVFSAEEIIAFAKLFDPMDFHTDPEIAKQSIFKGLISSGPHPFNFFHTRRWMPIFGKTVLCGLEVTNWKFLKPTYAGSELFCKAGIDEWRPNAEKKHAVVGWHYHIQDAEGRTVQDLLTKIMHYYDPSAN